MKDRFSIKVDRQLYKTKPKEKAIKRQKRTCSDVE